MAGDEQVDLQETCTEVEVTVRETTRIPSVQHSTTNNLSFEDQPSTAHPSNGGQLVQSTDAQRPPQYLMIYDPPPPYPGPPGSNCTNYQAQPLEQQQQPRRELHDSVTNEQLFAFNRYGQMVPAQQVTAVTTTRGRSSIDNLPGQIPTASEEVPPTSRPTPRPRIISEQQCDHARHAVTVRTRHIRSNQSRDYLKTSLVLLVLCSIQANLPAVVCTVVAVAYSLKAQQLNTQRQYNNARRRSGYALLCNTLAVIEYFFILTTGVMFVFIYFFGESVIY